MSQYGFGPWWLGWAALVLIGGPRQLQPQPFDWPQWRGPDRTAVSRETGLRPQWPAGGPPLRWQAADLGGGYSAPTAAAGRVFGMSYRGDDEVVWALDAADGRELWATRIAPANHRVPAGQGSRCSPTVDGDRLYVLGVSGDLVCLDAVTGKVRWCRQLVADFGGRTPDFGFCESPLVDGDHVLVTPGGPEATLVALDKHSGATVWAAHVPQGDHATYASIIRAAVAGRPQYIQFLSGGVVGVSARDGQFLWRYDKPANPSAICSTPVYRDGYVFAASSYNRGGGLDRLTVDQQGKVKAEEVYFCKRMKNQHGGLVLVGDHLYGCNDPGSLVCLEFHTGKVCWEERRPGKGSLAYADGRLYYHNQTGPVILIEANPKRYVERGRFTPPRRSDQEAWTHPVLANGCLYVRDQDFLWCYDIKQPAGS